MAEVTVMLLLGHKRAINVDWLQVNTEIILEEFLPGQNRIM